MSATEIEVQPQSTETPREVSKRNSFETPGVVIAQTHGLDAYDEGAMVTARVTQQHSSSKLTIVLAIIQPCLVNFFCSYTNGLIVVGLPGIAQSIALPRELFVWPASVYGLTSGAMLLLAGATADIVGARRVEVIGIFLLGIFSLACGLAQTGIQLVVFRALQGIASAMHLPASVAIVAAAVPPGKARNMGFGCLGLSQPLGFSVGLVVGGIMIDRAGWRSGFYLVGAALLVTAVTSIWTLPKVRSDDQHAGAKGAFERVRDEIDWIGALLASGGLAMLSYVLAILSANLSTIRSAKTVTLLILSIVFLAAFPFWMHLREQKSKTALVPNALWRNTAFASTCVMVALVYGAMNAMELFSSLYFQQVQHASMLSTSLRLLPNLLAGVCINLCVGFFVDRLPARWLVVTSSLICCLSYVMMAVANPSWPYWYLEFWAQIFAPFSGDVLFTVGLIIVSDSFPEKTQALAGAVFSTVSQFGSSLGPGLCQVVALSVADTKGDEGESAPNSDENTLLRGYQAGFWTMFACQILCVALAFVGLRKISKIGVKKD